MTTWIALLRGINMGGHHKLPMKSLAALLEQLGCRDVRTYIQSGNAVFRHAARDGQRLAGQIGAAIREAHGFEPFVLLLRREELERSAAGNPFPHAESSPTRLSLFFLGGAPERPDLAGLDRLKRPTETFVLDGATFYLHTPDGFGNSKLAARIPALLGVEATARNWRTVTTLLELARALD